MQPGSNSAVVVDFDVPSPMRDGTILRANVYRPAEGRWPVLLTRLPYGKDLAGATGIIDPLQAARRGYVIVIQDTRGRFTSEGEFRPFVDETDDGFDTVEWAASLPYADGQVGMYGQSYFGYTQLAAAVRQPPALKAIIPYMAVGHPMNGWMYRGGAVELGARANWSLMMGLDHLVRRHRGDLANLGPAIAALTGEMDRLGTKGYASVPLAEFEPLRRQAVAPWFFEQLAMREIDDELDAVIMANKHQLVQVPSFHVGGWFDIFQADTIDSFVEMRRLGQPTRLLMGPWVHVNRGNPVGELNFGFGSQAAFINLQSDFGRLQLRWFDHWLKGIDTGMLSGPPISLFVMGTNVWRDEEEWPLSRAVDTPFYLHEEGRLSTEPPDAEQADRYTYDPSNPVPTRGGALLLSPEFPPGPLDQAAIERRPDVLTFSTEPLERDTEVTGPIVVHLWACSSAPDTDFVARLVDVHPDGRAYNLADGIIRARFRDTPRGGPEALLEPGRAYEFTIDLWNTSNVFRAGHRIRLQVTSSCFPRWDRNQNTGNPLDSDVELRVAEQTILHDREHPSHVVLPLVP